MFPGPTAEPAAAEFASVDCTRRTAVVEPAWSSHAPVSVSGPCVASVTAAAPSARLIGATVLRVATEFAVAAVSAVVALGTFSSDDSLTSALVSVSNATSRPRIVLFRMSKPRTSLLRMSKVRSVLLRTSLLRIVLFLISRLSTEPVTRP